MEVTQAKRLSRLEMTPCGYYEKRRCWQVLSDYRVEFTLADGGLLPVTVRAGFIFDGASVPHVPGVWEMFGDVALEAACVHDWLYRKDSDPVVAKPFADWAFWAMMVETDDPPEHWKRDAMWKAVNDFGQPSYHKLKVADDIRSA